MVCLDGLNLMLNPLKQKRETDIKKEEAGVSQNITGILPTIVGRQGKGAEECTWPLENGNGPQLILSKEMGISVLHMQGSKVYE